jgi:excisionase family DNA binding protein
MSIHSTGLGDDQRLVVRPKIACHLLSVGTTRVYELLNAGELESFRDGSSRLITARSIRAYVERMLDRQTPLTAEPRRVSSSSSASATPKPSTGARDAGRRFS